MTVLPLPRLMPRRPAPLNHGAYPCETCAVPPFAEHARDCGQPQSDGPRPDPEALRVFAGLLIGPWQPRTVDLFPVAVGPALLGRPPVVAFKDCGCGVLRGEDCDCAELLAELARAARQPIFFDFNARKAA